MVAHAWDWSRRRFLKILLMIPAAFAFGPRLFGRDETAFAAALLAANSPDSAARRGGRTLAPTPECDDDDEPTPRQTEGPFFTPKSPQRDSLLEPGMKGTRIVLTGRVFMRDCRPVSGALLDFWHADDAGEYDNEGYRLRGHLFTDAEGRYRLETIVPGLYPGRTRHYHLKVQAPRGRVLTTQLYFPGETRNGRDGIFRPELLMAVSDTKDGKQGRFNFVLETA
jgi:protocatechuate 3,4-dioxygenase beta subunit